MSVEALAWALTVPVGGNAKVILLGLANHAHPDGSESFPTLDRLAVYAHCDRSTARRNLRKLLDEGWVATDGFGPRGQGKYCLALTRTEANGWQNATVAFQATVAQNATGGTGARKGWQNAPVGVAPVPPEPSLTILEPTGEEGRAGEQAEDCFPADLADDLIAAATTAAEILRSVATQRKQPKAITLWDVGHAVLTHPDRDHVRVARDLEAWLLTGRGARESSKDIVARYRMFLGRSDPRSAPPLGGTLGTTAPRLENSRPITPDRFERRSA